MRVIHIYFRVQTFTKKFNVNYVIMLLTLFEFLHYSGKAESQCQATPVEFGSPHKAICAEFVDICLPILHSY
jgi:hypothetical protein